MNPVNDSGKASPMRDRLVATASRLFYEQGYNLTGINQVIAEADIAKASLYQHFASKEDLLIECLSRTSRDWSTQLNDYVAASATPRAKVLATFDHLTEFAGRTQYRGCDFQNALSQIPASSSSVHALVRNHKDQLRRFFEQLLAGEERSDLAGVIAVLYEGALISSHIYASATPIAEARKLVEALL